MKKTILVLIIALSTALVISAQEKKQTQTETYTISGVVLDKKSKKPVEFATILLTKTEQWAIADANGSFSIQNVQPGKNTLSISCLGYITDTKEIIITKDIPKYLIYLQEDNLTLESVVVTAKENENSATTSRTIDNTALEHIQMVNVADISSLLPGGQTFNPDLTEQQTFNIRAGKGTELGNSAFGTAVEVDGVRLSGNASISDIGNNKNLKGVSTNSIASSNVESVEVITGVPSVEYGDMTSGVVKVNTKKGKTPYYITLSSNPRMKQISLSKGFGLGSSKKGASNGVLNASLEYTRSISELMSPFKSYDRKTASLTYSNLFNKGILSSMPLRFSAGVTGNIGGLDSSADPDSYKNVFNKIRDNAVRGNISLNWLLSKPWITNLELNASISYSDKLSREGMNFSSSSSTIAIHGREEGYFVGKLYEDDPNAAVTIIPRGYWSNVMCVDDKPINYKVGIKANWARQFGNINNKIKLGFDWTGDGNLGIGQYSENEANAPTYRVYPFNDIPFMNNFAVYLEENVTIPFGKTRLNIIAGLRNDNTLIKGSVYGNTSSLSPRVNVKYTIFSPKDRFKKTIKELSVRASWGIAVKQPSFSILYPQPKYNDIMTFSPTSGTDAIGYYAYYILPKTVNYNSELRWQRNQIAEAGFDIDIDGFKISLAGYWNQTRKSYKLQRNYEDFSYNYTSSSQLESICAIPADNRRFEVDKISGIVTVHDKTGKLPSQQLPYTKKESLSANTFAANSDFPINRYGLEWIIDFKRIRPINTTIRLDGAFYGYKSIDTDIMQNSASAALMTDNRPYRYVGLYYGGNEISNGYESRNIRTNLTITTHIPKVRMIVSLKVEATLMTYSRYLSERKDGSPRTYVISDKNDILSIVEGKSVYDGNNYSVLFPDYYTEYGNPQPKPFLENLKWAKENDPAMFNDLSRLAVTNNFIYNFKKDNLSAYFAANLSVTKEIGDIASISFYANNFFNNLGEVYSSKTGNKASVKDYIPGFFYGLSLRLKF